MERPCNHKSTYQEPASPQLKVCLQMPQALASSPSPHHYVSIYNQPLLLHKHLQPELAAECARSAGSGHHRCLPWTLATGPGDVAEDTTQDPPPLVCSTSQAPHSCRCCGSQWPEPKRHYVPLESELPHSPALGTLCHYTQGDSMLQSAPSCM